MRDEAACYSNIGTIDMHNKDLERATISYNLALSLLREHGEKRGEAQVCWVMMGLGLGCGFVVRGT